MGRLLSWRISCWSVIIRRTWTSWLPQLPALPQLRGIPQLPALPQLCDGGLGQGRPGEVKLCVLAIARSGHPEAQLAVKGIGVTVWHNLLAQSQGQQVVAPKGTLGVNVEVLVICLGTVGQHALPQIPVGPAHETELPRILL